MHVTKSMIVLSSPIFMGVRLSLSRGIHINIEEGKGVIRTTVTRITIVESGIDSSPGID